MFSLCCGETFRTALGPVHTNTFIFKEINSETKNPPVFSIKQRLENRNDASAVFSVSVMCLIKGVKHQPYICQHIKLKPAEVFPPCS